MAFLRYGPESTGTEELAPFEQIYNTYLDPVFRFCSARLGSSDAEDVTAETFTLAFAAYERSRPSADGVRAWLFTIARNACTDHHRRNGRKQRLWEKMRGQADHVGDVESSVLNRSDVTGLIAQLAERDRTLVALRCGADLSFGEIGKVMGMSEHTAVVSTNRAIERLKKIAGMGTPVREELG